MRLSVFMHGWEFQRSTNEANRQMDSVVGGFSGFWRTYITRAKIAVELVPGKATTWEQRQDFCGNAEGTQCDKGQVTVKVARRLIRYAGNRAEAAVYGPASV